MKQLQEKIDETYGSRRLADRLLENLRDIGCDIDNLETKDLLAFDELHIMGRQATLELGRLAGLGETMQVLDIGCGLGGPARTLANTFSCHVTGVDLSESFVSAATVLSDCVGLSHKVLFRQGNALSLPFEDGFFDAAVMLHLNMNIEDKSALFKEAGRVLKPGGKLLIWEVCEGNGNPVLYPVPWADSPAFSFLVSMQTLLDHLQLAGFRLLHSEDATDEAISWVQERLAAMKKPRKRKPAPDLDLVLREFRAKRENISKNLLKRSISILRTVASI
jgi:ubiquinone/menaquinone biosynthesis C-methylase UbiE